MQIKQNREREKEKDRVPSPDTSRDQDSTEVESVGTSPVLLAKQVSEIRSIIAHAGNDNPNP